jgi:hypothetical protein
VEWTNFSVRRRRFSAANRAQRDGSRTAWTALSRRRLRVEQPEGRRLLSISTTGLATWTEEGPGPILSGLIGGENTEGIVNGPVAGSGQKPTTAAFRD